MKHAYPQVLSCTGESPAPTADDAVRSARVVSRFLIRVRGLCIIRLVGVLMFAGATNAYAAAGDGPLTTNRQTTGSQQSGVSGPIRDPMNPQAYMTELASKLNSSDGKDLLLKGMEKRHVQNNSSSVGKTPSAKPAARPTAAAPSVGKTPQVPAVKTVEAKPQVVSKQPPAPQVAAATVWSGLSPDNRAAQRVLEELNGAKATKASAPSEPVVGKNTVATAADQVASSAATVREPSLQTQSILSAKPGLTLWTTPTPANLAEKVTLAGLAAKLDPNVTPSDPATVQEKARWSLGSDLDKYRAHAVKEGSRDSGQSLKKALERTGMTLGDGVNVFILGYGSDKTKPFRVNDGKGILDEPGKIPERAGATAVSLADGVYSLADLITLDSLPDPLKDVYKENNPLVRPLIFTGRTIGGVWKTTEEIGNAVTWGYFDNVTGCVGIVIEDILELFKHAGQAATNLVRAPVQLLAGKKEGTERAMDWVLLVPLEFVSNAVQMKGISNMDDYKTAFADKGVIGSVLEFGGSTFLVYRAVDEMIDEIKDDGHRSRTAADTPETPTDVPTTPGSVTSELMFILEGEYPTATTPGVIFFEGQWPTVTILLE